MSDPMIGRRALLRGAGGLAALAALPSLAACGTGSSRAASTGSGGAKSLTVRNGGGAFGEALQKAIYTPFTKETGIAVKVTNIQGTQMLAQIKQGRPQFDLIDNSMMDHAKFAVQDALEKLEFDRIKSFKAAKLPASMVSEHSVGKGFYATTLAYRTDAFGGRKPESWADFWDAKAFKGSRSMCNPDADLPELEFALLADGVELDKLYPLDVDRAFKVMDRIRADVKKYWDSGPLPGVLLSRQEVTISTVWHGRLNELIQQGAPLAYQLNGARRQVQGYAIPKGAANVDASYQLIGYSLRSDVQANLAKVYPTNPAVQSAYDKLTEKESAGLAGAPEYYDKGFDVDVNWWLRNEAAITQRWLEWARG
ncbi:ABC transporter substrate-binding protein [Streptomyces sp. DT2A-34]|uniref:ABC transporter substrate-binding protein n=1 Tax=Streptomyces sp. DT2A-34 TaxID=3051182 RepID=UPI00265BF6D5|nr:ABC transporter substrate-binding protein [Streptomyces sp. DT2A-34]MDO0916675.1 ABC transporter substrate-binding protein [Streptomyces sp. DT2A-34]